MNSPLPRRLWTIGVALAALGAGVGLVWLMRGDAPGTAGEGGAVLAALTLANFLLLLTLLFVLFRQLIKGFLEWRRQREGARFRTRLLTTFVLLGLAPSLLLFVGAVQMFTTTVDRWFQLPVHGISTAGQRMVDQAMDMVRDQSHRRAKAVAEQLGQVGPELRPALARHMVSLGDIDALVIFDRRGRPLLKIPENALVPDAYRLAKCFQPEGLKGWVDLSPQPTVVSGVAIDAEMGLAVGITLPPDLFAQAKFISENNQEFLRARAQRRSVQITVISSFLALTLAVTFAAVWIGSNLSREISTPLALLLEGTKEVSGGNLAHQIPFAARDEFGQVVSSFNRMIRDLDQSQRQLERSNQELRQISQSAERRNRYIETLMATLPIGVVSLGSTGEVRTLNPSARELLGMDPSDPPGRLLARPEWGAVREVLAGLPARPVANREVTLSGRAGQQIVSVFASALEEQEGQVFGTLVILEDISDLSRAQRIAAWQEVAQRLAHEIKNPLTPIRLSAQRIRKKVRERAPDLEHAVLDGTTVIEKEVEAMMTMVNEFSRFARLPEIHPKAASLPALLQDAAAIYRAAYTKVVIELDLPPDFPPVRFDWEQIHRVFKNLFENAIEAMEMSGTIRVRLDVAEGSARVLLRDTGPGIPEEARTRLFLPYFSTKRKGTGLGLAIVARVLEEHGGSIRVDEGYTGGAGFVVTLPL